MILFGDAAPRRRKRRRRQETSGPPSTWTLSLFELRMIGSAVLFREALTMERSPQREETIKQLVDVLELDTEPAEIETLEDWLGVTKHIKRRMPETMPILSRALARPLTLSSDAWTETLEALYFSCTEGASGLTEPVRQDRAALYSRLSGGSDVDDHRVLRECLSPGCGATLEADERCYHSGELGTGFVCQSCAGKLENQV